MLEEVKARCWECRLDGSGMWVDVQELRGSALQLLATGLAASPRVSGARSEHWPSIKIALEGLGLPADAVSACKIWLLQVQLAHSHTITVHCRPGRMTECFCLLAVSRLHHLCLLACIACESAIGLVRSIYSAELQKPMLSGPYCCSVRPCMGAGAW